MNAQKFTQKSMEILQDAQNLSVERSNTQVEQLHLLLALLTQQDGLIPQLMDKMDMDKASLTARAENRSTRCPEPLAVVVNLAKFTSPNSWSRRWSKLSARRTG